MPDSALNELLLIEIGGTHTRCAAAREGGEPEHITVFRNADHANLEAVVAAYLSARDVEPPSRAALAVAAPVHHLQSRPLTNINWSVDSEALKRRFGWTSATVINDFEALACSIPLLSRDELVTIRSGEPVPGAAVAVLGPGTGLGVSGLVPGGSTWSPISGEGGHVTLAAADEREEEVLGVLRRQYGHVSAERVLSGPGLLALYRVVANGAAANSPLDVTRRAADGEPKALETLELFFRFLGTVSSDVALTLGALGGVYLGGGMLPAMRDRLRASGFAERFAAKGRFTAYLEKVPVHLITADTPALRGLPIHPLVERIPKTTR